MSMVMLWSRLQLVLGLLGAVSSASAAGSLSYRNVSFMTDWCRPEDLQPGGIFAFNETYKNSKPSEHRSPRCAAYWADAEQRDRKNQVKHAILPAQTLLQEHEEIHPYATLNVMRMKRVLQKMATPNATVNIFVFGGSETAGLYVHGSAGAWPNEVEKMWNWMGGTAKAVKGAAASLHTTNLAVGGTSSEWMLHRLASFIHAEDEVDLVILEYDINDAALVADNPEDHEYFMTWTELLLRRLLLLPNRVAVLYFHTAVSHRSGGELMPLCSEYRMVYQLDALKRPLTEAYGVPMISQRAAIWRDFSCPPDASNWDCQSHSCAHPMWNGHQLMADIVYAFFDWGIQFAQQLQQPPTTPTTTTPTRTLDWAGAGAEEEALAALTVQPYLTADGPQQDVSICPTYASSIDRISAPFVARTYAQEHALPDSELGEGVIATDTADAHFKHQQKHMQTEYQHAKLVQIDTPCWQYREDVRGRRDKLGWVVEAPPASAASDPVRDSCFGASMTFQLQIGPRAQLAVAALRTWDKHAGLAELLISPPLTEQQISSSYVGADDWYTHIEALDGYFNGGSNEQGYSMVIPSVVKDAHIVRNATQNVRIRFVDANAEGAGGGKQWRERFEGRIDREKPTRLKVVSLSAC